MNKEPFFSIFKSFYKEKVPEPDCQSVCPVVS